MKLRILTIPIVLLGIVFSCSAQQPVTKHGVKITFTASVTPGVDSYQISASTTAGGPYSRVACTITAPATSCLDTVPTGNVVGKVFYVAQAHHPTDGWSDVTPEFTVAAGSPPVPTTTQPPTFAASVVQ